MKKISVVGFILAIFILLVGCASSGATGKEKEKIIKIGVTGGPPEEITNLVKEEAKKEGIQLDVIKFNDIVTPNQSLAKGELDINMFQAKQFLEKYVADRKDPIIPIGTTYNSTLGIYSEKYESVDDIPEGATLGVPNDPVNLWRGLLIFEEAGLIKIKDDVELATLNDIEDNPKKLKFKELDVTLMLRTLNSIDAGIVASTTAFNMGLDPVEESIYLETGNRFPMVVATNEKDKDNPDYKRIVELYHSDAVKSYIEEKYGDVIRVTDDPFTIE